mmetsp:Transcript_25291/g.59185  ORF Transcript_25291/g.59185 Transcript_25291/m.59185 type:complete len:200 (+) Transcript_25291:93-692(+)
MPSLRLVIPALLAVVHSGCTSSHHVSAFAPKPARPRRLAGAPTCPSLVYVGRNWQRNDSALSLARYDNLVSGVAEISIGFSLGVLWSEYAVVTTSCGPLNFSDTLERICYLGVILTAGLSLFTRIVTIGNQDLTTYVCDDYFGGTLAGATVLQVRAADWLSILAVAGAFVSLGFQIANGEQMDGLSGINTELCRAVRDL